MILEIYIVIQCYFLVGIICGLIISRKNNETFKKAFWLKFTFYFIIVNLVFVSIVFNPVYFSIVSILIIMAGYVEQIRIFVFSGYVNKRFFIVSMILFSIISTGFYLFSLMRKEMILYSFLIISTFDSMSQICGQLFGKRKIFPYISPGKTLEGFVGGAIGALIVSLLIKVHINISYTESLFYGAGIIIAAFSGDLSASYFKRKYKIKDFSKALPGQGGFLDRFDSLLAGGFFMYLLSLTVI